MLRQWVKVCAECSETQMNSCLNSLDLPHRDVIPMPFPLPPPTAPPPALNNTGFVFSMENVKRLDWNEMQIEITGFGAERGRRFQAYDFSVKRYPYHTLKSSALTAWSPEDRGTHTHIWTHTYRDTLTHTYTLTYGHTHTETHTHTHTHTHIYIWTHTCTHTHTHT